MEPYDTPSGVNPLWKMRDVPQCFEIGVYHVFYAPPPPYDLAQCFVKYCGFLS